MLPLVTLLMNCSLLSNSARAVSVSEIVGEQLLERRPVALDHRREPIFLGLENLLFGFAGLRRPKAGHLNTIARTGTVVACRSPVWIVERR